MQAVKSAAGMLAWKLVITEAYAARAAHFLRKHPDLFERYSKTV